MNSIPVRDKPQSTLAITKQQFIGLKPAGTRPTHAARAFNLLWLYCDDLGLTAYCALARCRGKNCPAEHYIEYTSFVELPTAAVAAVHNGGVVLSEIVRLVQERIRLGELTNR